MATPKRQFKDESIGLRERITCIYTFQKLKADATQENKKSGGGKACLSRVAGLGTPLWPQNATKTDARQAGAGKKVAAIRANSRFPPGMTTRKAKIRTTAKAKARTPLHPVAVLDAALKGWHLGHDDEEVDRYSHQAQSESGNRDRDTQDGNQLSEDQGAQGDSGAEG